jgi:hypothetical protein
LGGTTISVQQAMLVPLLFAIRPYRGWAIIAVWLTLLVSPGGVFQQTAWRYLPSQLTQNLICWVTMN